MSRNTQYDFVSTDSSTVIANLIAGYQSITGRTLQPADPDKLFLSWVADVIVKSIVRLNYVGNQNIPSRAEGANLDALGDWIYALTRKEAQPSTCTVRFHIVGEQPTAITIPAGTRVTDKSRHFAWATNADAVIPIGDTYVDVATTCDTPGAESNHYVLGQVDTLIDVDNIMYFNRCENVTETDGGADKEDDDTYFERMRLSLDGYSTAGAESSYIYHIKGITADIIDAKAILPRLTVERLLKTYTNDEGERCAFFGGDQIDDFTVNVYAEGSDSPLERGIDFNVSYLDGVGEIVLRRSGSVATANKIKVTYEQDRAGYVYLYALMSDGTSASDEMKAKMLEACNAEYVRPLTDYVEAHDLGIVPYDIDFKYYVATNTTKSLTDIQAAIAKAVDEYIIWQRSRIGRDINPSKLQSLLMTTGIKRVEITSPVFTSLRGGDYHDEPQVASVNEVSITNGGYEDE